MSHLPAHEHWGLFLFVHQSIEVSTLQREQVNFGEYIDAMLENTLQFIVIYRDGTSGLDRNLDDVMHVFGES